MRKRIMIAIAMSLALAPAVALAQPAQPGPSGPPPGSPGLGPQLARLLDRLNLTAEQRTSINSIAAAHRSASNADRQQMMTARRALMEKINAPAFDEAAIRQAAAAIAAVEANRAVDTAKLLNEIRAVLTPEQQKQFQEALTQPSPMRGERGPRGPEPGGSRPPGGGS